MPLELGRETDRKPPFKYSSLTRVGFSDTDAQGIVYYGRYLPYFDSARVEYHRHLDMLRTTPQEREFVMRANTIEYHAPARWDDLIEVFIRVSRRRRRAHGDGDPDARPRRPRRAARLRDPGLVRRPDRSLRARGPRAMT